MVTQLACPRGNAFMACPFLPRSCWRRWWMVTRLTWGHEICVPWGSLFLSLDHCNLRCVFAPTKTFAASSSGIVTADITGKVIQHGNWHPVIKGAQIAPLCQAACSSAETLMCAGEQRVWALARKWLWNGQLLDQSLDWRVGTTGLSHEG